MIRRSFILSILVALLLQLVYLPVVSKAQSGIITPLVVSGMYHTLFLMPDGRVKGVGYNSSRQVGVGSGTYVFSPEDLNLSNISQVAVGRRSSYAVDKSGDVYVWGYNSNGELGNGNTSQVSVPTKNTLLSNVVQVVGGDNFGIALLKDGTLKAWGNNSYGQLGTGNLNSVYSPTTIPGISEVKKIVAGSYHVAALLNNGTIKVWGRNNYGQLGLGNSNDISSPKLVTDVANARDVVAGWNHTFAIINDNSVKAWGENSSGQLGIGTTTTQFSPVPIIGLSDVRQMSVGVNHAVAVLNNGKVKVWGNNSSYQLGLNSTTNQYTPVDLQIDNITYVVGGYQNTFLVSKDYSVNATGSSSYYQLGFGDANTKTIPTKINLQVMTVPLLATGYIGNSFVSAGINSYATFIYSNGEIKATGRNDHYQLGMIDTRSRSTLTTIADLTGVKQIVGSEWFTLALMEDGSVKSWGFNGSGQLGLGDTSSRHIPTVIPGLIGVKQLAVGGTHVLALMNNGSVKAWGYNVYGQLGTGDFADKNVPTDVIGLTGVKKISAGLHHSLALMNDGSIKVWGFNGYYQLGLGNTTNRNTPISIPNILSGVKDVIGGSYYSMALMEDGKVMAWGNNSYSVLGMGNTSTKVIPTMIPNLSGVKQISAGFYHAMALLDNGSLKSWGLNDNGQLGLGDTVNRSTPTTILGLTKVKHLATGAYHSIALLEDGVVRVWGQNSHFQLGLGDTTNRYTPTALPGLSGIKQVSAGMTHILTLTQSGTVYAWGKNGNGQLGLGHNTNKIVPTLVSGLSGVKQLVSGRYYNIAVLENGTVRAWGSNGDGQLGLGHTSDRNVPTTISGLTGVKQIAAGSSHTLALMNDGKVRVWGKSSYGALGLGSTLSTNVPVEIPNLAGVKQIAVGNEHSLAVMEDGSVRAWGRNHVGQLGIGNYTDTNIPTAIPNLTGVKEIEGSAWHSFAVLESGLVKSWGYNYFGQLGVGDTNNKNVPTNISGLSGVKQVVSGGDNSFALLQNGTVKAWGFNTDGQLGVGHSTDRYNPADVLDLNNAIQIDAGGYYTVALLGDGTLKVWGNNFAGQLGQSNVESTPQLVQLTLVDFTPGIHLNGLSETTVSAKLFLDSSTEPMETKNTILSDERSYVNFETIDYMGLTQGAHKLVFEVTDGVQLVRTEVPFEVTDALPLVDTFELISDTNAVTASGSSSSSTLAALPYRLIIGDSDSGWKTGSPAATHTASGLQPNTKYPVEFQVKNANGQITKKNKDAVTLAVQPSLATAGTTPTTATFTVTDTNPLDTSYQITVGNKYVSTDGTLTGQPAWIVTPDKKITVKGLQSGQNYKFQIKARNKEGIETAISPAVQAGPPIKPPAAPTGLKVAASTNQLELSWKPILEATSYQVEADGAIVEVGIQLSYMHNNLSPSTSHLYRVRALKNGVPGEWSEPLTAKTLMPAPAVPSSVTASATAKSVTVQWSSVMNTLHYEVEWDGQLYRAERNASSYVFREMLPGSQHAYRVRAINTGGPGPWSPLRTIMTLTTAPAVPTGLTGVASDTTVQLNWQKVEDATYYEILANGVVFYNGEAHFASLGGLQPNTAYQYSVRAWNELGASAWSSPLSLTTFALATPKLAMDEADDTALSLKWAAIAGATGYELERNGVVQQVSGTSVLQDLLQPETTYAYRIRAKSASGNSAWSTPMSLSTLPAKPQAPSGIYAVAGKDYITLNWESVTGAGGYQVEIDGKVVMDNFESVTYTDEQLDPYTPHTYRIRAVTNAVQGDWTAVVAMRTLPEIPQVPEGITLTSSGQLVYVSWAEELSANRYEVEINGSVKDAGLQTKYTHRRVTAGSENRYRVRTINDAGVGAWSNLIVNNTITAKLTKGKLVDLNLTASDVTDFSKYILTVNYDAHAMKVIDLSALTGQPELATGRIEGTDITITYFTPGRITFVTDKPIESGQSWTGIINSIKFQGLASGGSSMTYTVVQQSEVQ